MKKANLLLLPIMALLFTGCAETPDAGESTSQKSETSTTQNITSEVKTAWSEAEKALMKDKLLGYEFPFVQIKGGTWQDRGDLYYVAENISVLEAHQFYEKVAALPNYTDVIPSEYNAEEKESDFYREVETFVEDDLLIHCVMDFEGDKNDHGKFAMIVEAPILESSATFTMEGVNDLVKEIAQDEQATLPATLPFDFTYLYKVGYVDSTDALVALTMTIYTTNENAEQLFKTALEALNLYTFEVDEFGDPVFLGHNLYGWFMYQESNQSLYIDISAAE